MFTLSLTLGTSIVLGTLKPYRQRQAGFADSSEFFGLTRCAPTSFAFDLRQKPKGGGVAGMGYRGARWLGPGAFYGSEPESELSQVDFGGGSGALNPKPQTA